MDKQRENNLDLLRVLCCIGVVMIHVSQSWVNQSVDAVNNGIIINDLNTPFIASVYNSLFRFAVDCFLMISGSFILDNSKTLEYKEFYYSAFKKIGIPALIFSVFYILYETIFCIAGKKKFSQLVKGIITGAPMYHMWYLYMLIGIYVLAPLVMRFKNDVGEKQFRKISYVFLILANISRWTTGRVRLNYDVGQSFEYLSFFMAGYCIHKESRHNNRKALLCITGGIMFELFAAYLQYQNILAGISEGDLKFKIVSPYSPLIVTASVLIFKGFAGMRTCIKFKSIYIHTFNIYLIHAGIWDFCRGVELLNKRHGGPFRYGRELFLEYHI